MTDIIEFLLARVDEDQAIAGAACPGPWTFEHDEAGEGIRGANGWAVYPGGYDGMFGASIVDEDGAHIARWDPARVLAECASKRAIVDFAAQWFRDGDEFAGNGMLEPLTRPYESHPDFDPRWVL